MQRPRVRSPPVAGAEGGEGAWGYPALTATLSPPAGDANLRRIAVKLPSSEFLAQEHIRTVCTRVQYAAGSCPDGSIYGYAEAVTPLLGEPLRGPVYLRSSDHTLPDLAIALRGQISVDLAARIDSKKRGIRATFTSVPDAPISRFVLRMRGGKKGLLVNSKPICRGRNLARVTALGQNDTRQVTTPVLLGQCGKKR